MSAADAPQPPRPVPPAEKAPWPARLAALLSFRTISGRLIVGLIVLLGVASIIVSVVTAASLSNSLVSSIDQQLQSSTMRWQNCLYPQQGGGEGGNTTAYVDPAPGCAGQESGTFEAELTGTTFSHVSVVLGNCQLSPADEKKLLALPTSQSSPPAPGGAAGQAAPLAPAHTLTLTSLDGDYRFTKVKVTSDDIVITGLPLDQVEDTLHHVENTEHVVFAVVLLLAVILGAGLVQLSLRPLRRVAATATMVTELPLDSGEVTLPAGVPDNDPRTEVGRVGAAFNRMLFHVERALGRRTASEARLRRFAADASHELRTPLSAIRGYAEFALRHPGPVPQDVTHALKRVQSESARMTVLVDDLLLLARLDAGRPLERAPVDMSRLAIETTSDARVARTDHRYRLDLPDEPVVVPGDEHRLHQVLANLLSNAGKHTPPDTTVSVALTLADITPTGTGPAGRDARVPGDHAVVQRGVPPLGPRVELSITDDGPGIPPELLPELFERFTRADTSRAREASAAGKSTGLGLAIVDAVVAAHGGCIIVTSKPGMTRFTIILPMVPEPAGQPQPSPV
jgi:two-component system, OmpR family, sensor kinase